MHRREDRSGSPIDQQSPPPDPPGGAEAARRAVARPDGRRRPPAAADLDEPRLAGGARPGARRAGRHAVPRAPAPGRSPRRDARRARAAGGAGRWTDAEVRLRTRRGEYRWILFNAVYAPEERLLYISGKDVSTRRGERRCSTRATARWSANLPDTVVTLFDPELRIVVAEGAPAHAPGPGRGRVRRPDDRRVDARGPVREDRAALPRRAGGGPAVVRHRHARRQRDLPRPGRAAPRRARAAWSAGCR